MESNVTKSNFISYVIATPSKHSQKKEQQLVERIFLISKTKMFRNVSSIFPNII
jgi:hypothetical protein